MTVRLFPDRDTMRRLVAVARRTQAADLVVSPGALIDVFTEEILEGWGVAIAAGRVAYVGPDAGKFEAAARIEGDRHLLAPGLIEGHTHLLRLSLGETVRLQLAAGVTTSVFEAMELAYILGPAAVRELLADAGGLPGRALFTVPTATMPDPLHDRSLGWGEEWVGLLDLPGVIGVGEANWTEVIRAHPRVEALIEGALARGLTVEGHGAGAKEAALNATAGYGITADHEGISGEDQLARLRLGLYAMLRHGATRQDLPGLAGLWNEGGLHDYGRLALVSDSLEPQDLLAGNSLNRVVEIAVENGMPLARAVRLASRNVAERFGLGRWLGGLAPGMLADLVLIPRGGRSFRPELVLVGGRRAGELQRHRYPESMTSTIRVRELDPGLFRPPPRGRWRAIEVAGPLVTREVETDGQDALVAVAIDRLGRDRAFRGLVRGLGMRGGAVAASTAWDGPCLIAVGDSADDMHAAVRRVQAINGGAVVVRGRAAVAEWPAPLAGVLSLDRAENVVGQVDRVNAALREMGSPWPNPLLTIETLTTGVIPHLRLWAEGYVRLRDGAHLGLAWT